MKQSPDDLYQHLIKLIELSEVTVKQSALLSNEEKQTYLEDYRANRAEAEEARATKNPAFLRTLQDEILTPWNETSDEDSQHFWELVKAQGLDHHQEDHLKNILDRGRIADFKEYNIVQDSLVIWQQEGRIDKAQAAKLSDMLAAYETKKGK